jgi:hypothetical protein
MKQVKGGSLMLSDALYSLISCGSKQVKTGEYTVESTTVELILCGGANSMNQ